MAPVASPLALLPLACLLGGALVLLLLDAFLPASRRSLGALALLVLAAALGTTLAFLASPPPDAFPSFYSADAFGHVADVIVYLAALAGAALSLRSQVRPARGEYWPLLLLATAGMVALCHAASLVTVFVAVELLSLSLYVLTGFLHEREKAVEAALKYFFLGAFSTAFLVYGIAFVYGSTGSFELARIGERLGGAVQAGGQGSVPLTLVVGMGLLLVGFGFKVSSVPFHMWTPDVYEGAPTPVTAFMSVGTKAAAFTAFLRVFTQALGAVAVDWQPAVAGLAIASMFVGNLIGLTQRNLKRMLAFSSIAHAGYALIGLVAWEAGGREAVVFYLLAYAFMNLGAFGILAALENRGEGMHLYQLSGLSRRRPYAAAAMALFLLSLAGVPPTAGFVGKLNLLLAAVETGWIKLAVLAVLYSTIAAYFYLRVIVEMYMKPSPEGEETLPAIAPSSAVVLAAAAAGVLVLGLVPSPFLRLLERAVSAL